MNKNIKTGVCVRNGVEIPFNFSTNLRAVDKMRFVNSVTDLLVGENYNFVIRNLIFDYMLIEIFTDFDTSDISNSENYDVIGAIEDLLNDTNIVDIVKANAEYGLIEELNKSVDENIEYRTGIHKNPIAESLSHLLNTLEQKVFNIDTEELMKMAQDISEISGELTADKVIEVYSKSDIFKKNSRKLFDDDLDNK